MAQLYRDAGIVADEFVGVPVFQAEGLTVKTERARYTPLFLARADLDAAVGNAYSRKGGKRKADATAEVAAAAEADQKAQAAVRGARVEGSNGKHERILSEKAGEEHRQPGAGHEHGFANQHIAQAPSLLGLASMRDFQVCKCICSPAHQPPCRHLLLYSAALLACALPSTRASAARVCSSQRLSG